MRYYFNEQKEVLPFPDLVSFQKESFLWFKEKGVEEVLEGVGEIEDGTGRGWKLLFCNPRFELPEITAKEALDRGLTYFSPWYLTVRICEEESDGAAAPENAPPRREKEQEIFMGSFPEMTERGTFIINGVEKVVVGQLTRSEGAHFTGEVDPQTGRRLTTAKIIPKNGAWLEFSTAKNKVIKVSANRSRKFPVTVLFRAFGIEDNREILSLFSEVDSDPDRKFMAATLAADGTTNREEAVLEIFRKVRPGDRVVLKNAEELFAQMFCDPKRFDLGRPGRFKLNQVLGLDVSLEAPEFRLLTKEDLVRLVSKMIDFNNGQGDYVDIDHLANRRVRRVGELVQQQLRLGFLQMVRNIRGRMSIQPRGKFPSPKELISARPVAARLSGFFASGQLSQYQDQNNPLSFLSHLRRLTVKGPGGLTQQRASLSVRDVHYSHYGRICPIETPEGPNIGFTMHTALYARVNDLGFLEVPYRRVAKASGPARGGKKGPRVTDEIVYLTAWEEENYFISNASINTDKKGYILDWRVPLRKGGRFFLGLRDEVDYVDITPSQIVGASAATIPFLAHDDANRALMASNMSRQAVPLIAPEAPLVGTGVEGDLARNSGALVLAEEGGEVSYVDAKVIKIKGKKGQREYELQKFEKSNDNTCLNQVPRVSLGDRVGKGDFLADGAATELGELALGVNLVICYLPWLGYNYEDAFVISRRLVEEDVLTSIHISEYRTSVLETKLGPEEVTRDIPNVSEEALRNLDEEGIVAAGSEVKAGGILVGKIAPKGESELSAEERLLRSIFGEQARDIRDTSLRMPHGGRGTVIGIKVLTPESSGLGAGVLRTISVRVAQRRKVAVGDKLVGRHGNKGVISAILPREDMPFLEDGTPVDIIMSSASVISRMNVGQLLESHLGMAGRVLGKKYAIPPFLGFDPDFLKQELAAAGLPVDGKRNLRNGLTGKVFAQRVVVGEAYILKLEHLVEDKMHARSTGPYALITQQPLGGKSQFGGQRFGEMEVWALEAYRAADTLQEMLTVKSDDVAGRGLTYRALVQGETLPDPTLPESFKLLIRELNGLCLEVEPMRGESSKLKVQNSKPQLKT